MKTQKFEVTVTVPPGATLTAVKAYIENAVDMWSKGGNPDSPLWDVEVIKVRTAK